MMSKEIQDFNKTIKLMENTQIHYNCVLLGCQGYRGKKQIFKIHNFVKNSSYKFQNFQVCFLPLIGQ